MKYKKAVFVRKNQDFEIRKYELEKLPSPYHVQVAVKWVGICGSDISALEVNFMDEMVLGHEWVGEAIHVGDSVKNIKPGDYVTSGVKIECGYCSQCLDKKGPCENLYWLTASHGMFCERATLPEAALIQLPQNVSKSSTLFEILAVAENVWIKAKTNFKDKEVKETLIMGAGLLGLSMGLILKREGIKFRMVETIPSRIERARSLGFECIHLAEALISDSYKDAFHCIVDATGDHLGSKGGWRFLEHFGASHFKGIILAKYINEINFSTYRFFSKQASLQWIQGCTNESLEAAIEHWKDQIENLGQTLITHTFGLDEIGEAFATAKNREESARVVVKI